MWTWMTHRRTGPLAARNIQDKLTNPLLTRNIKTCNNEWRDKERLDIIISSKGSAHPLNVHPPTHRPL
jgi:hypothetical protein